MEDIEVRQKLFRKIFVYHGISLSEIGLKEIWFDDLRNFTTKEIQAAWDDWRNTEEHQNKKPKPYDLVKIIRRTRSEKTIPEIRHDILVKGKDFTTDLLIDGLEKMKINMPDYQERMRECQNPYDKLMIGLSALKIPDDRKSELISIFRRIMPSNSGSIGS